MITPVHIVAVLFATFALSRAMLRWIDKKISHGELVFWIVIWSGLIFVVFFPDVTTQLANAIGIGRGIDVIIYTSIGLLFYMIFRLYVKLEENERRTTILVREMAIVEKTKKKNK